MKDRGLFERISVRAQDESHPRVDVADDVLEILASAGQQRLVSYRPLVWIASASSAIAACVTFAAYLSINSSAASSMTEFYQAISWVAQ